MIKRIDQSVTLSRLIQYISTSLARQRGLPVVFGITLVLAGFVVQLADVYVESQLLQVVSVVTHNLGLLIAIIGLLMADPLGK